MGYALLRWQSFFYNADKTMCFNARRPRKGWRKTTFHGIASQAAKLPEDLMPSKAEWMPEVGEECEATWLELPDGGGNDFCKVKIKGLFGDMAWFSKVHGVDGYDEVMKITDCEFRPLKTAEEKKREYNYGEILKILNLIHSSDFCPVEAASILAHEGFTAPEGE